MSDLDSKKVLDAAADLVEATGRLVRAVAPDGQEKAAASPAALPPAAAPKDPSISDSDAWLDYHHPGGKAAVKQLGERYFAANVPATAPDPVSKQRDWDPSLGATWKDFARIYRWLFDRAEVVDGNGAFLPRPYDSIQKLQALVGSYNADAPDEKVSASFPWPPMGGPGSPLEKLPALDPNWTRREAISIFLSLFNKEDNGKPANRDLDFNKPAGPLRLTHGQVVELLHAFERQEDLRLLAPYDVLNLRVW